MPTHTEYHEGKGGDEMNHAYLEKLFSLGGKNAIVTGGSQGIGRGIAVSLANFGANVTVVSRNQALLEETAAIIRAGGGLCETVALDVADRDASRAFFDRYMETHRQLDIFVNNAGFTVRSELADTADADIDALLSTNLVGALTLLKKAANQMKAQHSGNIVVITSVNGLNPLPGQGMYSVTKFALEGATKALASSLAEYGVRVNSCAPGAIDTAMNAAALSDPTAMEATLKKIPMSAVGAPADIGDVVACMVSDACRYMTGATVVVDGGLSLKHK